MQPRRGPIEVALLCDSPDENWRSMDITSSCLAQALGGLGDLDFAFTMVAPPIRRRFRMLARPNSWFAFTADRVTHRFYDYPRLLRSMRRDFDLFHIMDQSHAHLAHELPAERTILTVHDLDTFACLIKAGQCRRSTLFRAMTRRILTGFQKAARVISVSETTRNAVVAEGLAQGDRTIVIPNGIQPLPSQCSRRRAVFLDFLLGHRESEPLELLHVGNNVPRKRIDVLIHVLAGVRRAGIPARLIRVGDEFTPEQRRLIESLSLTSYVTVLSKLTADLLAAVYRRADLLLQPSEAEGFGLPVVESMSQGTPVIASDIPALREFGGAATTYCPVGDIESWTSATLRLSSERIIDPAAWQQRKKIASESAGRFNWESAASKTLSVYREIVYDSRMRSSSSERVPVKPSLAGSAIG